MTTREEQTLLMTIILSRKEKQIKIAEQQGFERCTNAAWQRIVGERWLPKGRDCHISAFWIPFDHLPEYLDDLDAMQTAEDSLSKEQFTEFMSNLCIVCMGRPMSFPLALEDVVGLLKADAGQHAEAFGLTLKLWEAGA